MKLGVLDGLLLHLSLKVGEVDADPVAVSGRQVLDAGVEVGRVGVEWDRPIVDEDQAVGEFSLFDLQVK